MLSYLLFINGCRVSDHHRGHLENVQKHRYAVVAANYAGECHAGDNRLHQNARLGGKAHLYAFEWQKIH